MKMKSAAEFNHRWTRINTDRAGIQESGARRKRRDLSGDVGLSFFRPQGTQIILGCQFPALKCRAIVREGFNFFRIRHAFYPFTVSPAARAIFFCRSSKVRKWSAP